MYYCRRTPIAARILREEQTEDPFLDGCQVGKVSRQDYHVRYDRVRRQRALNLRFAILLAVSTHPLRLCQGELCSLQTGPRFPQQTCSRWEPFKASRRLCLVEPGPGTT